MNRQQILAYQILVDRIQIVVLLGIHQLVPACQIISVDRRNVDRNVQ